jgi:hypothetical protein
MLAYVKVADSGRMLPLSNIPLAIRLLNPKTEEALCRSPCLCLGGGGKI